MANITIVLTNERDLYRIVNGSKRLITKKGNRLTARKAIREYEDEMKAGKTITFVNVPQELAYDISMHYDPRANLLGSWIADWTNVDFNNVAF